MTDKQMKAKFNIGKSALLTVVLMALSGGIALPARSETAAKEDIPMVTKTKVKTDQQLSSSGKQGSDNADADLDEVKVEELEQGQSATEDEGGSATDKLLLEDIVEPETEYHYAAFNQPDPFLSPFLSNKAGSSSADVDSDEDDDSLKGFEIPLVSELQRWKLEELELKGIWRLDSGEKRAMILTQNKQGIIVKEDDPIANGKIIAIDDKKITVRLYTVNEEGAREFKDEKMYLGSEPQPSKGVWILAPGKDPVFEDRADRVKSTKEQDTERQEKIDKYKKEHLEQWYPGIDAPPTPKYHESK